MKKQERILAWHFTNGMKLRNGDDLIVGKTYHHNGLMVMCDQGYHASERLIDALRYAPGSQLSRVEVWGDVDKQDDKIVGRNRKVLWTMDATKILHLFACDVAEKALAKIDNPDPRSLAAVKTKRRWLDGKATDEELSAAYMEARAAAYVAYVAARAAARVAARVAANVEARAAAYEEFNTMLTTMVEAAHAKEANE